MCRIAAYIGPTIPLENIVTSPRHSLLSQSIESSESKQVMNGDGFGLAWYGQSAEPGVFRECLPAWSDENLINLCRMVQSNLFIAHVRASTTGETVRTNCHPFKMANWTFAHNGQIGGFSAMQREIESLLSDELYNARRGTTDSELLFLLLTEYGLHQEPVDACRKVIALLEQKRRVKSIQAPLRLTFVFADGDRLFGARYASDRFSPTLYRSRQLDNDGVALASEPLDGNPDNWMKLQPATLVEVKSGDTVVHDLV